MPGVPLTARMKCEKILRDLFNENKINSVIRPMYAWKMHPEFQVFPKGSSS